MNNNDIKSFSDALRYSATISPEILKATANINKIDMNSVLNYQQIIMKDISKMPKTKMIKSFKMKLRCLI